MADSSAKQKVSRLEVLVVRLIVVLLPYFGYSIYCTRELPSFDVANVGLNRYYAIHLLNVLPVPTLVEEIDSRECSWRGGYRGRLLYGKQDEGRGGADLFGGCCGWLRWRRGKADVLLPFSGELLLMGSGVQSAVVGREAGQLGAHKSRSFHQESSLFPTMLTYVAPKRRYRRCPEMILRPIDGGTSMKQSSLKEKKREQISSTARKTPLSKQGPTFYHGSSNELRYSERSFSTMDSPFCLSSKHTKFLSQLALQISDSSLFFSLTRSDGTRILDFMGLGLCLCLCQDRMSYTVRGSPPPCFDFLRKWISMVPAAGVTGRPLAARTHLKHVISLMGAALGLPILSVFVPGEAQCGCHQQLEQIQG
uniref:Uncharacterized protein n=1 Tax=Salix viminalis TaxID=40686 RepID=A0A6N2M5B8_SALVM